MICIEGSNIDEKEGSSCWVKHALSFHGWLEVLISPESSSEEEENYHISSSRNPNFSTRRSPCFPIHIMSSTGLTETTLRATGISLMITVTIILCARTVLRVERNPRFSWEDIWLVLAWLFFMAVSGVYVSKTGLMFRLLAVQEGRANPYPSLAQDALDVQKTFFFTSPGLWLTLWSVKFSLLAFYKKLLVNVPLYVRMWWAVLVYCISVSDFMFPCNSTGTRNAQADIPHDAHPLDCPPHHSLSNTQLLVHFRRLRQHPPRHPRQLDQLLGSLRRGPNK